MGFFSSLADNLLGAATTIPCVCPVKMVEQLKKLIPPLPPLPEIPIPKLDPLAPIATAAPAAPANSFIRERLDVINKMRVPSPLAALQKLDPVKIGQLESAAPLLRTIQRATGAKITDPQFTQKVQGSLLGLAKIPVIPPPLAAMPPPPPPVMQKLAAAVTHMRMAQSNMSLKLCPMDPSAIAKTLAQIQVTARAVATIPPFPAEQLAPVAPLASLVRVTNAMGIDLTKPGAMVQFSERINTLAKLPPPPPANIVPALPAAMNILSVAQVYENVALFFKLDLAKLTPPMFIAKIGVPLQPLVKLSEQLNESTPLTPAQAANAQSWAAAAHFLPALQLMETLDLARLDLKPLENLPDLAHAGAINNALTLGEAAGKAAAKSGAKKCPQCPLG